MKGWSLEVPFCYFYCFICCYSFYVSASFSYYIQMSSPMKKLSDIYHYNQSDYYRWKLFKDFTVNVAFERWIPIFHIALWIDCPDFVVNVKVFHGGMLLGVSRTVWFFYYLPVILKVFFSKLNFIFGSVVNIFDTVEKGILFLFLLLFGHWFYLIEEHIQYLSFNFFQIMTKTLPALTHRGIERFICLWNTSFQ